MLVYDCPGTDKLSREYNRCLLLPQLLGMVNSTLTKTVGLENQQDLLKMRRKLFIMLMAVSVLAISIILLVAGTLCLPMLRRRTWCVLPVVVISGLNVGHVVLFFSRNGNSKRKKKALRMKYSRVAQDLGAGKEELKSQSETDSQSCTEWSSAQASSFAGEAFRIQ